MNEEGVELRREERGVSEKGDAVTSNAHRRPPPHLLNEADVGGRRAKKWERARARERLDWPLSRPRLVDIHVGFGKR